MSYKVYVTKKCIHCKETGTLVIWEDDMTRYLNGALAHDAFPDLIAPVREQIISGTHPECWTEMFKDYDGK
jgi:hypothetical protein